MAWQKKNRANEVKRIEVRRMKHIRLVSRLPSLCPTHRELQELADLAVISYQAYGKENKVPL